MVPVVCPCLDSDRWHNIYSLKSQTISSQKTMFSSSTWDHNICKVTKSCTSLWTLVYDYYVPLVNLYYCFAIVMVQQTLPVVLCLEHPMKDKRSGYLFNVSESWSCPRHIFFLQKHANVTFLTRFCSIVANHGFKSTSFLKQKIDVNQRRSPMMSFIGLLTISRVSLLLVRDWILCLRKDFSLILVPVFIHYTSSILIKIKFTCLVYNSQSIFNSIMVHRYINPWILQDIYTRLLMTQINLAMKTFEAGTTGEMNTIISRVIKYSLIEEFSTWYVAY